MAEGKKINDVEVLDVSAVVDGTLYPVYDPNRPTSAARSSAQQIANYVKSKVIADAAHATSETADQAKLASVGKVMELIGSGRRVEPITSAPATLNQDVIYLVHDSDEDITFGAETVHAGTTARVYHDGNGWVVVEESGTPTPGDIMSALEERLDTADGESVENATIPTTEKVEEMIGGSGNGNLRIILRAGALNNGGDYSSLTSSSGYFKNREICHCPIVSKSSGTIHIIAPQEATLIRLAHYNADGSWNGWVDMNSNGAFDIVAGDLYKVSVNKEENTSVGWADIVATEGDVEVEQIKDCTLLKGVDEYKQIYCSDEEGVMYSGIIFLPPYYNPKTKTPLLVYAQPSNPSYSGCWYSANHMSNLTYDWIHYLYAQGFAVLIPYGFSSSIVENYGITIAPSTGVLNHTHPLPCVVNAFAKMVESVCDRFAIDSERVVMYGYSLGGQICGRAAEGDIFPFRAVCGISPALSIDGNDPFCYDRDAGDAKILKKIAWDDLGLAGNSTIQDKDAFVDSYYLDNNNSSMKSFLIANADKIAPHWFGLHYNGGGLTDAQKLDNMISGAFVIGYDEDDQTTYGSDTYSRKVPIPFLVIHSAGTTDSQGDTPGDGECAYTASYRYTKQANNGYYPMILIPVTGPHSSQGYGASAKAPKHRTTQGIVYNISGDSDMVSKNFFDMVEFFKKWCAMPASEMIEEPQA